MKIKFKKLSETAKIPSPSRKGDIGFDLCCDEDVVLQPGSTYKIKTNLQLADMPVCDHSGNEIFLKIEGRSGLASKGIFPSGGIIDPNYRGEIGVVLNTVSNPGWTNELGTSSSVYHLKKGDRIAQLLVYKVIGSGFEQGVTMMEDDIVTETNRGTAGFGSSGR